MIWEIQIENIRMLPTAAKDFNADMQNTEYGDSPEVKTRLQTR